MRTYEDLLVDGMKICQESGAYKFTSDSVLLSRFARAKKNDVVADLCAGSGIVGLHFYALNRPVVKRLVLFEMQKTLCDLARESVRINALENVVSVREGRVQDIGAEFAGAFSLVLCNPPYYPKARAKGENFALECCKYELSVCMEEIVFTAAKCLKSGGRFCVAYPSERLAELMFTLKKYRLEPKRLAVVSGGKKAYLALAEAVKDGRAGLKIEIGEN